MGLREDLEEENNEELMRLYKEGPARAEDKDKVVKTAGEILSDRGVPLPKKRATAKSRTSDRESRMTIWGAQDEHDIMTRSRPNKAKTVDPLVIPPIDLTIVTSDSSGLSPPK